MLYTIGQSISILGMILAFVSFQFKKNKSFFICQAASGAAFALSFFLLGSYTAALLNSFNILRGYSFGLAPKKHRNILCIILLIVYTASTVFTYTSPVSILIWLAQIVGTIVMWKDNGKIIRITQFLFLSPAWLIHNIIYFSLGGILCESFNMLSTVVSIIRYRKDYFSK